MIPVNYHHLYYFWMTAKSGSISAAAKNLFLTQPALSAQISQLEKALGKTLLQRGRHGVSLTPAGKIAFAHCEVIFTNGEALLRSLKSGPENKIRTLRLGIAKSAPREIALRILEMVEAGASGVLPELYTGAAKELSERLERHALDLAICDEDLAASLGRGFRGRLAGDSHMMLAAAPKLAGTLGRFSPRSKPVPMLLRSENDPLRWDVERFLRSRGIQFSIAAETDDPEMIRILALRGKGAAALSVSSIKEDVAAGRLTVLYKKPTELKQRFWLCASVHPNPDAIIHRVKEKIMSGFKI